MDGQIGVLYQKGEQIAGITNWEITLYLDKTVIKGWSSPKVSNKNITAWGYWLTRKPEGDEYEAHFYQQFNNELILIDRSIVKVSIPDAPLGKKMLCELEIFWIGHVDEL
ncbi:hypothetical protein LCGC14_2091740 [marine sediment metagenome]|uniref:Uncharacterized protein n=1 Tax=marine sediment metagenome TaxID=412755 RepID=A0A0F9H9F8_9ZZZZ